MNNIGIIGLGYVGSALQNALFNKVNLFTLDINKDSNCNNLKELSESAETIFICLPTPMKTTGECDTTLIEDPDFLLTEAERDAFAAVVDSIIEYEIEEVEKNGEEEIPENCVGVITPDSPDVLSHISVRARNSKTLLATCFSEEPLADLRKLSGRPVKITTTARGDVEFREVGEAELTAVGSSSGPGSQEVAPSRACLCSRDSPSPPQA